MDAINKAAAAMDHIAIYTKDLETSEAGVAIAAAEVKIMECFIKYQVCSAALSCIPVLLTIFEYEDGGLGTLRE